MPAAGAGVRLGCTGPKGLVAFGGRPLLVRTLERFGTLDLVDGAVIVVAPGYTSDFEAALTAGFPGCAFTLVEGGTTRQESVTLGLQALAADTEIVAIHDAARPFVTRESIQAALDAAARYGASTVAVPVVDTILEGDGDGNLVDTPDRRRLWACQTPQVFHTPVIRDAHDAARREGYTATDDASLVRRAGGMVKLVEGTPLNFKVTTPTDLALAECVLARGLA